MPVSPMGGEGGAGLLIFARGIFITRGSVDLSGGAGDIGVGQTRGTSGQGIYQETRSNGGGGGGGSFVALVEEDANGLPNLSIFANNIITGGGTNAQSGLKIIQVITGV